MMMYDDNRTIKFVQHIASASTLISSVTAAAKDYIISKFPKDFFRSIYIDSEETSTTYYREKKYNDKVMKVPYPNLGITPEISLDDPIGGMAKSPMMSSTNLFIQKEPHRHYRELLRDQYGKFNIFYTADYVTINLNFRITLKKFIQNINAAYFMKARFQPNYFQYLNDQIISTEVPKSFIKALALYKKLDLENEDDMLEFEDFLASHSTEYSIIHKKRNLSTGKTCFFFDTRANLLTQLSEIDCPTAISRNQMVDDEYQITFRLQVSTWLPNSFIFSLDKSILGLLGNSFSEDDPDFSSGFYSTSFERSVVLERTKTVEFENSNGEKVIGHEVANEVVTYEINELDKEFSFMSMLKPDMKKVHAYLMSHNLEISDVFHIKVLDRRKNNADLDVNYETLSIKVGSNFSEEFMFILYVDRTAADAILKIAIPNDKFLFNENALAELKLKLGDEIIKAKVYSFISKNEMNSNDINKSLRIQTPYGIGYVGLVDIDSKNASPYRICVGMTKLNEPIIKAIET